MKAKSPLFDYLKEYSTLNKIQFHIPGHKAGTAMDQDFVDFMGPNLFKVDLINIEPLDDLHLPKTIIKEAQDQTAKAYLADKCFYSVQGTSTAIMSMIMSVVGPGDKIIVPRNVHKSILTGIIFAGANPVYVYPQIDERYAISHGLKLEDIKKTVHENPDAKAILLINPTYYGYCTNIEGVVEFAHSKGIPVLVDEAHGAHLPFSDRLPISSMQSGADLAATSIHKLGGALTGGSILNYKSTLVDETRVAQLLSMFMTTSTSYPIMASIDVATKNLLNQGEQYWDKCIDTANYLRNELNKIEGINVAGKELLNGDDLFNFDETKVLVNFKDLNLVGHDCEIFLREKYNIEVELSDINNILLFISPAEDIATMDLVVKAIKEFITLPASERNLNNLAFNFGEQIMTPRDAFYATTKHVPIDEAVGKVAGETIMVYPPGIPVIGIGEEITLENIEYIKANIAAKLPVKGMSDYSLKTIKVVGNESNKR